MIMFWNQKEVFIGYSMQKFSEVRQKLADNEIKYKHRLVNNNSARDRTGTFGENMEYSTTYYIYVHKNDYEYACATLKNS